jgi:homoserine O-succinyltransferase/O-acetyltransferase
MTVVLDKGDLLKIFDEAPLAPGSVPTCAEGGVPLEVGLLNNMPDSALAATERQYVRLFEAAGSERLVRLHFFSLPTVTRSAETKARLDAVYHEIAKLKQTKLDGLIVTGAEPKTELLQQEPYWPELSEIIDWAKDNTTSTIWSCLAAHAAVLYLDGIARRRLPVKCSGVFASTKATNDALTDRLRWPLRIFHSRLNDLAESDLVASNYRVLTRAPGAGVDIFVKRYKSLFVFFQGHPEYDPLSLRGEYLRDVGRFLSGTQETYPAAPAGYFDPETSAVLDELHLRALRKPDPAMVGECRAILERSTVTTDRRGAATTIFRNWFTYLAENKVGRG